MKIVLTKPEDRDLREHASRIVETQKAYEDALTSALKYVASRLDLRDRKLWVDVEKEEFCPNDWTVKSTFKYLKEKAEATLLHQIETRQKELGTI